MSEEEVPSTNSNKGKMETLTFSMSYSWGRNMAEMERYLLQPLDGYGFNIVEWAVSYPMEYANMLMQLGYEPMPPRPDTTIFGTSALYLPNIFQYIGYIMSRDGFLGCYRGLAPRMVTSFVSKFTHRKIKEVLKKVFPDEDIANPDENDKPEWSGIKFLRFVSLDLLARLVALVASHPLRVVTVRCVAQFVSKETAYTGVLSGAWEVYKQNGIGGYFQGLMPKLMGEAASVCITSGLMYLVNNYVGRYKDLEFWAWPVISGVAISFTHPYSVVSNSMAVNNSGLAISSPPYNISHASSKDCYNHLAHTNQLMRGAFYFFRFYTGPYVMVNGEMVAKPTSISTTYEPDILIRNTGS